MTIRTLFDKVWEDHIVDQSSDSLDLIYIDRHLIHEVTSPQAFDGLRINNRKVRRPDLTFATMDHNVPTTDRELPMVDAIASKQIQVLDKNCKDFGITLYDLSSPYQGIVHVIGPELGITLPGLTIACGDSHTSTHGAFGSLAFGVGTSQVEHILATQCLWMKKPQSMEIRVEGKIKSGVTAKDTILYIIRQIGTSGGTGSVIEYAGSLIRSLSIEERMTVCNMSIEAGARAGMVSPDEKTINYIKGKMFSPKEENFNNAVKYWQSLKTDSKKNFDKNIYLKAENIAPQVSWGTNPSMVTDINGEVPSPEDFTDPLEKKSVERALKYMKLKPKTQIQDIKLDRVFIGSCTNSRLEDLKAVAEIVKGHKVNPNVKAMVVPGSQNVKKNAENLGIDKIIKKAGFEWRESGCSMCLGMNPDILLPGERCASTSNRNFEGRQGKGGLTHLVSPIMAATAAISGHFVDVRDWI